LGREQTVTKREEEKNLLKKSADFLETAEYQTGRGIYDLAIFSLEQALQLFLKAKVLTTGSDYPRIHSVRNLLNLLSNLSPKNKKSVIDGILQKYSLELGMLEDAYITSRYIMREFMKAEAEKLTQAVKDIMKNVQ
jgi:HEPN domain-containing protein